MASADRATNCLLHGLVSGVKRPLMGLDMLAITYKSSRLGCMRILPEVPFNSACRYLDWLLTASSRMKLTGVPFNDAIACD